MASPWWMSAQAEVRIPLPEGDFPIVVEHLRAYLQQQVGALGRPLHLLFFDHALADHLVDGGFDKAGTDPWPRSVRKDQQEKVAP